MSLSWKWLALSRQHVAQGPYPNTSIKRKRPRLIRTTICYISNTFALVLAQL
jgi:hypothetical protein